MPDTHLSDEVGIPEGEDKHGSNRTEKKVNDSA